MPNLKKLILAYSGGLDTSYCLNYLKTKGFEVHTVLVNTGGFSSIELDEIKKKALKMGSFKHIALDVTQDYYHKCLKYLIFGNVLKNNTYPLSVSSERIFQAIAIAEYAKKEKAQAVAHGSTGAGNDQVRFDLAFQILCPDIEIITPIRDQSLSREEEINFLKSCGIIDNWEEKKYSINKGLWGTSIGGKETLKSREFLPDFTFSDIDSSVTSKEISIEFKQGEPYALNGKILSAITVIQQLNELAIAYGIGRDIHVGDTIVGIKGRVGFEAGAALMLIKGHETLEKHTLTKSQIQHKSNLADWYGSLVHEGQFLEPFLRDVEAFLDSSQKSVSGTVFIQVQKGHFTVNGIESEHDLMKAKFGIYGEKNIAWTASEAKGFIKLLSTPLKNFYQVNSESNKNILIK
jgi:argininosuccinate synthase